jgi:hypothetical protein
MNLLAPPPRRRASRRPLWLIAAAPLAFASPIAAAGCTCSKAEGDPAATSATASARPAASAATSEPGTTSKPDREVKPVYPIDAGPPDPLALRFCEAVQTLPEKRKEECCVGARLGVAPVDSCVRTLSYALSQHAVTVAPADLDRCAEAMKAATSGCDWVTPFAIVIPPACVGILKGALAAKAPCRSSLECAGGLRCQGLSATDLGVCGPPRAARFQCGVGIDTLAAFTRQDQIDRDQPECEGRCTRGRCEDAPALGAECKSDAQCGKNVCIAGKCAVGALPALGAACPGGTCAPGAGCVNAVCVAPKAEGAACASAAECRGECVLGDAGQAGTCSMRCPSFVIPQHRAAPGLAPSAAPKH